LTKKSNSNATSDTSGSVTAMVLPEQENKPNIRGHIDMNTGSRIIGWIADETQPTARLTVEVSIDGRPVARVPADQFRADVLREGIGDGRYGFQFLILDDWFDGQPHAIDIRDVATGHRLTKDPLKFQAHRCVDRKLNLSGSTLAGSVTIPEADVSSLVLQVFEGGEIVAIGTAERHEADPAQLHFRIPLPGEVFDGRPHMFSVRADDPLLLIGEVTVVTPYMLTPETALIDYAKEGLRPALSAAAGFRYQSLVRTLEDLLLRVESHTASSEALAATVEQLLSAHSTLVKGFKVDEEAFDELEFPVVEQPTVSVIIPAHNKFEVTYHCLASLLLAPNRASFEVIIVDDASSDRTEDTATLVRNIEYVRNEEPQGFVKACNAGAAQARGDYIVLLNNDTEVTESWLDELIWPFEHFDSVGLTGAKLLYPDGTLQEAGGIVWDNGDPWNYGRGDNPHDPRYCYTRQVDYISGACIMLPKALWQELNGLDESFVPAYFEDTDLAFRIRARGLKTVYCPLAQVVHFEGLSSGTSTASGMKRYQELNRPKFKQRWISACRGNGRIGSDPDLQKDRNVEMRVLMLDAETPMPDKNAGSYAAIQEIRMLQALGCKCTFAPMNMAWMSHYTAELQRMGVELLHSPFYGSISDVIQRRGSEFDVIYVTRYNVAKEYLALIREFAPQAKLVLNNADLHFLRELRAARHADDPEAVETANATREAELEVMRDVDLVLSYTDVERAVILSHNPLGPPVAKGPWVAEVAQNVPAWDRRADIAFFGGFNHHPNAEAVQWFLLHVLPLIREALPDAIFRIYGSNVPDNLKKLARTDEQVSVEGWVPSVDAVYDSCRVFVAPLQSGAGIKGKVIGALAHGVPSVLSPIAVEGTPIGEGMHAEVASSPKDWAAAILRLYENEATWTDMSGQALSFARNHYGFKKGVSRLQAALEKADVFTSTDNLTLQCH